MKDTTDWINELRNLGASEAQLKELEELRVKYKENDIYKKIEKINYDVLGERIRPVTISNESAYRLLNYNIYGSIDEIITQYKNTILLVNQNTTPEIKDYTIRLVEELQEIGVYNATEKTVTPDKFDNIEFYYQKYKRYEDMGDIHGMYVVREHLISLFD